MYPSASAASVQPAGPDTNDTSAGAIPAGRATLTEAMPALELSPSALNETVIEGIQTNIALHRELMVDAKFMSGGTNIHYLEEWLSSHKR